MASRRTWSTPDQVIKTIEIHNTENLALGSHAQRVVLKAGPRTYKAASLLHIASHETGEIVKKRLTLTDYQFRVWTGIDYSAPSAQWACEDDEIEQLKLFLNSCDRAEGAGEHAVVKLAPGQRELIGQLIAALKDNALDLGQISGLIAALAERATDLHNLPRAGEDDDRRMVAAALRAAHRSDALRKLSRYIAENATEQLFQDLLSENWWMLGGRYIRMVPRRNWTTDETLDILLQTADGYFEIIELKRSNAVTFATDHGHLIPSAEVHRAVNQAAKYIAEIEAQRDTNLRRYNVDLFKLRAKVLIGHIGEDDAQVPQKREALRQYNAHLHGIEVITYDQLERIAKQVVEANTAESEDDGAARPHGRRSFPTRQVGLANTR